MNSNLLQHKGAKLTYIPFKANGMQSPIYDGFSLLKAIRGFDVVVLGVSGGLFFPIFRLFNRKRLIVNVDGMEHKRAKWGLLAKLLLEVSEEMALLFSDVVIADNQGIVDNMCKKRFKKKTVLIAYGGDHVKRQVSDRRQQQILDEFKLRSREFSLAICRIEPENIG